VIWHDILDVLSEGSSLISSRCH